MLSLILTWLNKPVVLLCILVTLFVGWSFHEKHRADSLDNKLDTATKHIDDLTTNFNNYQKVSQGDQDRLQHSIDHMSRVNKAQHTIREKLETVPKTSTDHPFADTNLLNAGRMLRDYQTTTVNSTTSD